MAIKKVKKSILRLFIVLLVILVVLLALVNSGWFQSKAADWTASYLQKELNANITIGDLRIKGLSEFNLKDVFVADTAGDTLAFFESLNVADFKWLKEESRMTAKKIELNSPIFYFKINAVDSTTNLQFLIDYFKPKQPKEGPTKPFKMDLDAFSISNGKFYFDDNRKAAREDSTVIDWAHIGASEISLDARNLSIVNDRIVGRLAELSLNEKSGFELRELFGDLSLNGKEATLSEAKIKTDFTDVRGNIGFSFKDWGRWKDFTNRVKMEHTFDNSVLEASDLAYFVPALKGINRTLVIDGKVSGRVKNLKAKDIKIQFDLNSAFEGDATFNGLPNFQETFIDLDIKRLVTNAKELQRIPLPPFEEEKTVRLPANFSKLGKIVVEGQFTGFVNDFVGYGVMSTALGTVQTDIKLQETEDSYSYSGNIGTTNFDLGSFYDNESLGTLTTSMQISDGSGLTLQDAEATLEGKVDSMTYKGYTYKNFAVDGKIAEGFFDGLFSINDENVSTRFEGKVDFRSRVPNYNFVAEINNLDFVDLNLLSSQEYSSISGTFELSGRGTKLEDLEGNLDITNLHYCSIDKEYLFDQIKVSSVKSRDGGRKISLFSPIASGKISGNFKFDDLIVSAKKVLADVIPSVEPPARALDQHTDFSANLVIENFDYVQENFLPEIYLAPKTRINCALVNDTHELTLSMLSDTLSVYGLAGQSVLLDGRNVDESLYLSLVAQKFYPANNLYLENMFLDARTENDTIYTDLAWENEAFDNSGNISGNMTIRGNENFDYNFRPSTLSLFGKTWEINESARVEIDSTAVNVQNFIFSNAKEYISISGDISKDQESTLNAELNSFDLSLFNIVLDPRGLNISGKASGYAGVSDFYDQKLTTADLIILDAEVNDFELGDLCLESNWNNNKSELFVAGEVEQNKRLPLKYSGFYRPKNKTSPIDIDVFFDEFDLDIVNAFVPSGASDIAGLLSGKLKVSGVPTEPIVNGLANIEAASVRVDYLNTSYYFDHKLLVEPDGFYLLGATVYDEEGTPAILSAQVMHENFKEWNFDISAYLDEDKPFKCLNTSEEDNALYYGVAYATGVVGIEGYAGDLNMQISAKTESGTQLYMPIGSSSDIEFGDFITFVDKNAPPIENTEIDLSGINLNLELDITEDAGFEIIFDQVSGDIMSGAGRGHLSMNIDQLNQFTMYGPIEVTRGSYLFTLKNLLKKNFEVEPGGTIQWYGDPFNADMNLSTTYSVQAAPADLLGADVDENLKRKIPVDLYLNLSGKLLQPTIGFDIALPTADELTKNRVASALSTESEINRQAFALLALRSFFPPTSAGSAQVFTQGAGANTSELISSQLNNWISQLSDQFDIGLHYKPGDDITDREIALALSTQFFNDRINVEGNFGVSQSVNTTGGESNPSNLIGDIRIEYKTINGKIRFVVYNESNDFDVTNTRQNASTQGLGVLYVEEFDTMEEFFAGIKALF